MKNNYVEDVLSVQNGFNISNMFEHVLLIVIVIGAELFKYIVKY